MGFYLQIIRILEIFGFSTNNTNIYRWMLVFCEPEMAEGTGDLYKMLTGF